MTLYEINVLRTSTCSAHAEIRACWPDVFVWLLVKNNSNNTEDIIFCPETTKGDGELHPVKNAFSSK